MTIIDFYKELSDILRETRENLIPGHEAEKRLEDLLEDADKSKLYVNIDMSIINKENLLRLDDENSFRDEDDENDEYYNNSSY